MRDKHSTLFGLWFSDKGYSLIIIVKLLKLFSLSLTKKPNKLVFVSSKPEQPRPIFRETSRVKILGDLIYGKL